MSLSDNQFLFLVEATAWRYRAAGRFTHGFVRGKLRHDPVYRALLDLDAMPSDGFVLDVGCGRGIALSLLTMARSLGIFPNVRTGSRLRLCGIERNRRHAAIAASALNQDADVIVGDIRSEPLPRCRTALLLDVLMYLTEAEQDGLLQRVADAVEPGGLLILREANAGWNGRFVATWLAEKLCALGRGDWRQRNHYRSATQWRQKLESLGFSTETRPASEGTPFANELFIARRLASPDQSQASG